MSKEDDCDHVAHRVRLSKFLQRRHMQVWLGKHRRSKSQLRRERFLSCPPNLRRCRPTTGHLVCCRSGRVPGRGRVPHWPHKDR
jgi:hypothetical protein